MMVYPHVFKSYALLNLNSNFAFTLIPCLPFGFVFALGIISFSESNPVSGRGMSGLISTGGLIFRDGTSDILFCYPTLLIRTHCPDLLAALVPVNRVTRHAPCSSPRPDITEEGKHAIVLET